MGKTSYGERYMIGSHHGRVFIFDHQGELQERLKVAPCYTFKAMRERAEDERIVCFDYSAAFPGQLNESFEAFCDEVFDLAQNSLEPAGIETLFVCDEVQKTHEPAKCPRPLKNIVQTGRRFKLDSLLFSQQPNRISNEIREQVTELVLFRLNDENSLKFIEDYGENSDEISSLQPLEYVWFNLVTGIRRKSRINWGRAEKNNLDVAR